jgi:hypothetical protein
LLQGKTKKFLDFVSRYARLAGLTGNRTNKQKIMKLFTNKDIHNAGEQTQTVYADYIDLVYRPLPWQELGLSQTASGYGRKLTNACKINFNGKLYRLYSTIFSNSGSVWFTVRGKKIFVN